MYGCERWTIKKVEHQRIDAFELWCWRRLLRVPWAARRSNQSILKEINPEYSLEGLILKLQYFGHLIRRTDSPEKTLMLGKTLMLVHAQTGAVTPVRITHSRHTAATCKTLTYNQTFSFFKSPINLRLFAN